MRWRMGSPPGRMRSSSRAAAGAGEPPRGDPPRPCGDRPRARRRRGTLARRLRPGYDRSRPPSRAPGLRGGAGSQPVVRTHLHAGECHHGPRRRCRSRHRMGRARAPPEPVRPDELPPLGLDRPRPFPARRVRSSGGGGAEGVSGQSAIGAWLTVCWRQRTRSLGSSTRPGPPPRASSSWSRTSPSADGAPNSTFTRRSPSP